MKWKTTLSNTFQLISFLVLLSGFYKANAQNIANQSVQLGSGSGHFASQGPFNGCGIMVNAGWQKTLKNNSLRFSPDLTAGFYNNNCTDDPVQADFTSLTFRGILNFDFIQSGRFAAFIGGGPVVNYSFGDILDLGGLDPNDPRIDLLPQRETQFHPGLAINVGLRFVPNSGRLGFEMIPVNVQFDFNDYSELIFYARFFYSLDAQKSKKAQNR